MKKHPTLYQVKLTVQPPKSCEQTCELTASGSTDDETGRLLWPIAAAMCEPIDADVDAELKVLRRKLESAIPDGHRAEAGRLADATEVL